MDERGFITRLKYDVVTGAPTQRIDDVDTAQVTEAKGRQGTGVVLGFRFTGHDEEMRLGLITS